MTLTLMWLVMLATGLDIAELDAQLTTANRNERRMTTKRNKQRRYDHLYMGTTLTLYRRGGVGWAVVHYVQNNKTIG